MDGNLSKPNCVANTGVFIMIISTRIYMYELCLKKPKYANKYWVKNCSLFNKKKKKMQFISFNLILDRDCNGTGLTQTDKFAVQYFRRTQQTKGHLNRSDGCKFFFLQCSISRSRFVIITDLFRSGRLWLTLCSLKPGFLFSYTTRLVFKYHIRRLLY